MRVLVVNTIYFENYKSHNQDWDGKTAWWKRKGGSSKAVAIILGCYGKSLDIMPSGFEPIEDCEVRNSLSQLTMVDSTELLTIEEAKERLRKLEGDEINDSDLYFSRISLPYSYDEVEDLPSYRLT